MSGLPLFLTPVGRAALVDAANTGTSGLLISHIGVSASGAGVAGGALQGEIKRLTTFAGQVVADDTIHVTIRDDSTAAYSLRAFALYLQDGTLLAWYAQPGVILEKSEQAMLLLSADLQFQNLNVTSLEFGDSNWTNPIATTTVFGVLRLATNEVALAGTSVVDAITPAGLFAVLNARFGIGAPSDFVKGLLNLATAALFRTAIGLGSASLRNEGAGNGLDADLLDGQQGAYYRDWANLTNKPGAFPPTAHGHAWGDLSGVPSTATRWPTFDEVTSKPSVFPPSAHTHSAADVTVGVFDVARIPDIAMGKVTGLAGALGQKATTGQDAYFRDIEANRGNGTGVVWLSAVANGRYLLWDGFNYYLGAAGSNWRVWHEGNFNPGTKSNVGHTHTWGEVNPPARLGGICYLIADWNLANENGWYMGGSGTVNSPSADWYMGEVIVHNPEWIVQRIIRFASDVHVEYQRSRNGGTWTGWERIYNTQTALDGRYAVRGANNTFRDITAHRGDGSGVIFLNGAQTRYLFYTGTRYELSSADLKVDGTVIANALSSISSDARLKEDIADLPDCLEKILRLRPRSWRWKADGSCDFGFVAQEHREVLPQGVHSEDQPFEDGEPLLSVRYGKAEPYLVGAVQELAAKLESISARLRDLESRGIA